MKGRAFLFKFLFRSFERLQHFLCVALRLNTVPDLLYFSIRPDQRAASDNSFVRATQEFLRSPKSVRFDHFVVRIAQQRKVQFEFFLKPHECFHGIGADSEDLHIQLFELLLRVAKLGRFYVSTGSVRLGIEIEQRSLSFQIF